MQKPRILIVEDEGIVVLDIQRRLEDLDYSVIGHVNSGSKAVEKAYELRPDLVLMDIKLHGDMDGISAAEQIIEIDIPVIYLTAFADNATLNRAKITEPFGYILKPFEQRELHTAIQIALHNHKLSQEVKRSQKWLAATLNGIGDAVVATNKNFQIEFINPVAETLLGWQSSDVIGKDIHEYVKILNMDDKSERESPIKECLEKNSTVASYTPVCLNNRDNQQIPIDFSAAPTDDYGAVLVFHDISKRVSMEDALKESEILFRSLTRLAPVGIFRSDLNGDYTYVNDYLLELTGLSKDEFLDNGWRISIHPNDLGRINSAWKKTITHQVPFREEHRLLQKGGKTSWVISEALAVQLEANKVQSYIGAVMDITQRKNVEHELKNLNEKLEELVEERTEELSLIINAMAGREVRMAELKKVIKVLRTQLKNAGIVPIADDPLNEEIL